MDARAEGVELALGHDALITPLLTRRVAGLAERTPADLTFGNIWLFRRTHRWRLHEGPWPYISGIGYDGRPVTLPLFDLRQAPTALMQALITQSGPLLAASEAEAQAARAAGFGLAEQRDDADYVYAAHAFRTYRGPMLRKKANLMAQLRAAHVMKAEPYGAHMQDAATTILNGWMRDKGRAPGDADEAACRDALEMALPLGLRGFLYWANDEPAGFLLAEALQPGVWAIRFAKGLVRFKGIAQYMFHHFACQNGAAGTLAVDWLNFEQDLGLPNFRQTKMSYQPAFLLPKWRVLAFRT